MSETKQQWKECKNLFEGEYGKFFVCNFQKVEPWWYNSAQFDKSSVRHIVTMNGTTIESEMPWYDSWQFKVKADEAGCGIPVTKHGDSNMQFNFCGTDPQNPLSLFAEIEFTVEDELHVIDRPCSVYVPKGVQYGPIRVRKLDRLIIMNQVLFDSPFYYNDMDEMNPLPMKPGKDVGLYGGKWGKCFITNPYRYEAFWYNSPGFDHSQFKDVVYMDKESLPNGLDPYNTCFQWKFKPEPAGTGHPLNYHPNAAERVAMIGTDPDNPWDLGGEIEFVIGNEKHVIDRPCIVYVPKMMKHGQVWFRKVDRPIIQAHVLFEPYYCSVE